MVELVKIEECPDCGSQNIVRTENEEQLNCLDCGLMFEPVNPQTEEKHEITKESTPKKQARKRK